MSGNDQARVRAFLANPETHGGAPVEVIETHISTVFLAGERAFKLKRAIRLPYADFSTLKARLATCERELELNAPQAPALYLRVRRITRARGGGLEFDGPGALVDAVVEMARFGADALFSDMAREGRLTPGLMEGLAATIAGFHAGAPVVHQGGGAANIAEVLDINRAGLATSTVFAPPEADALDSAFRDTLERHAATLDAREAQGWVRRCHGDLHLRNICMFQGRPTLFDCIEFSDRLANVDVLYDLAFLLMDLWARGLHDLAALTANRWFDAMGEDDGFALLPFLMALRAEVRAHVIATQAERGGPKAADHAADARRYFDLARALLRPAPVRAIVIGGRSGTGKTTVAEALAAHVGAPPGARIVESDRTRKALFGVSGDTRLPPGAYRDEISGKVYAAMTERARAVLKSGASVVADAVFDREERRTAIAAALAGTNVAPTCIWLEAGPAALRARVRDRRGGPSDATVEVLERQLARDPGRIAWARIDSSGPVSATVGEILRRTNAAAPP
ncbi:MAG: AAA family ATPase [Rhodobacteraceae bacterium]|nr:AAA family ATPase [Paracoccaceae bacterium]